MHLFELDTDITSLEDQKLGIHRDANKLPLRKEESAVARSDYTGGIHVTRTLSGSLFPNSYNRVGVFLW